MPYGHFPQSRLSPRGGTIAMPRPGLMGRMGQGALTGASALGQAYQAYQTVRAGSAAATQPQTQYGFPEPGMRGFRRRMNVCNPKALRRAIRRTHGFAKLAMKTIHLVHPKKQVRFGGFRKKRAKR